jgi:creatinine amidohydrolase/Fe(II)-dependent formamide hydrolase-like protein
VVDDGAFWPWYSSPAIEAWPDSEETVVVLPLAGLADWGLGHPLDAEETVLMHVLQGACRLLEGGRRPLVAPPLRFAFGADPSCAFPVDQPTAHAFIAEVAASVAASGFRKMAIINSSPWSEELCNAAARDLRVTRGLHMFHIHLSALELDFHPVRSKSRRRIQTLLTALHGREPEAPDGAPPDKPAAWGDESVTVLSGSAAGLAEARIEGAAILGAAAGRLAKLLSDIYDRESLSATLTPP